MRNNKPIELNLIPMMDTFVTLIGFLLYTMAFLGLVVLDSPIPQLSPEQVLEKIPQKPLQLTVTVEKSALLIWSPFGKITPVTIPHLGSAPNFEKLTLELRKIKARFAKEEQAVLLPLDGTSYEWLIDSMDAIRIAFPQVVLGNLVEKSQVGPSR